MKANSERLKRILNYFGTKKRGQLREDFLEHYRYHVQTYYNKLNPNAPRSYFSKDEIQWIERWAIANGMPPAELEESKPQTAA